MTDDSPDPPPAVSVHLTPRQRHLIRDQTGHSVSSSLHESVAQETRCTFGGIPLRVPRGVSVPSATTERLLHAAIQSASAFLRPTVVDVGTGCGAIALGVANALPRASVIATDVSAVALRAARANRARLKLRNVRFAHGSLLDRLPRRLGGNVAVIVGNIPYVPPRLADAVERTFPEGAPIGTGKDGLGLVRELADTARKFLARGGSLILELADFQWPVVGEELVRLGYEAPEQQEHEADVAVAGRVIWPG